MHLQWKSMGQWFLEGLKTEMHILYCFKKLIMNILINFFFLYAHSQFLIPLWNYIGNNLETEKKKINKRLE